MKFIPLIYFSACAALSRPCPNCDINTVCSYSIRIHNVVLSLQNLSTVSVSYFTPHVPLNGLDAQNVLLRSGAVSEVKLQSFVVDHFQMGLKESSHNNFSHEVFK